MRYVMCERRITERGEHPAYSALDPPSNQPRDWLEAESSQKLKTENALTCGQAHPNPVLLFIKGQRCDVGVLYSPLFAFAPCRVSASFSSPGGENAESACVCDGFSSLRMASSSSSPPPSPASSISSSLFKSSFSHLPVMSLRKKIVEKIQENRVTLIIGETGCGNKTF